MSEKGGALSVEISNSLQNEFLTAGADMSAARTLWFAVQTRARHEKKANLELHEKGIECFLPLQRERRRWSDRYSWVELPLFSQYFFVRIPNCGETRARVLQTTGVVQFVGATGRGTPVPANQIDALQAIVAHRIPMTPHAFLHVGDRVRIRGGALEGIEGVLSTILNDKSLVVSVDLIQKSVAIRIDGFEVERA